MEQTQSRSEVQLYLEPLDADTNRIIATYIGQAVHDSFCEDRLCADGLKHNLWKVSLEQLVHLHSSGKDGSVPVKIFQGQGDKKPKEIVVVIVREATPSDIHVITDSKISGQISLKVLEALKVSLRKKPKDKVPFHVGRGMGRPPRKISPTKARKR